MAATPVIICLKSDYNNKFLRYRYEDVQTHGLLQFAGEKVVDPFAHFEVHNSKTYDGLVHLKSRFNDKYLVRWSPNHYWITASANKPDENKSSWTCTLFNPIYIDRESQKMRLVHVQLGHYASTLSIGSPFDSCLFAGSKETDGSSRDVFTLVYWESVFKFPRRVAFKDRDGKYLAASMKNGLPSLSFSCGNATDPTVAHEMFTTPDGTLCIKSNHFGKFWSKGDGDWILADADDPRGTNNAAAMFRPTVLDINLVALLNMSKTWFVKSSQGFLNAASQNVEPDAKLEIIDLGMVCCD